MKMSRMSKKRRLFAIAAAGFLLAVSVAGFPTSAESSVGNGYSDDEKAAMATGTLTFVGVDGHGNPSDTDFIRSLNNYNDYNYTGSERWVLMDRYFGLATDSIMAFATGYSAILNPTATRCWYAVVEWNTGTKKFEVSAVYGEGRRVLNIPRYGFVLFCLQGSGTGLYCSDFFQEKLIGTEVRVNLDDYIALLKTRNINIPQNITTYYELLLRATDPADYQKYLSGEKSVRQSGMEIEAVDTYVDCTDGAVTELTGTQIRFRADYVNAKNYNDHMVLYDSGYTGPWPTSSRGFYIPLAPVEGEPGVYQVGGYTIPKWDSSDITPPTAASVPEGGYLLCSTHFLSAYIKTNAGGTIQRADQRLYEDIAKYFAVGKKFKITNQEAYADVVNQINALGQVTPASGPAIAEAQAAYDALPAEQQALVSNADVLSAAQAAFETYIPVNFGAQIRVAAPQGLRFGTRIDTDAADGTGFRIIKYGTVLMSASKWESGELKIETNGSVDRFGTVLSDSGGVMEYGVTVINIPENEYSHDIMARSYVVYKNDSTGEEVMLYNQNSTEQDALAASKAFVCNVQKVLDWLGE